MNFMLGSCKQFLFPQMKIYTTHCSCCRN